MDETDSVVSGIVNYLRTKNQLDLLPKIIEKLHTYANISAVENTAVVTSAYQLGKTEITEVQKQLFKLFGRKLEVVNRVDAQVIGGFVVQISDKIIDLSLNNYLSGIEERLKNEKN